MVIYNVKKNNNFVITCALGKYFSTTVYDIYCNMLHNKLSVSVEAFCFISSMDKKKLQERFKRSQRSRLCCGDFHGES